MASRVKTFKTTVGEVNPDILAYTVGQDHVLDLALVDADCLGTAAHATMLARTRERILSPAECRAIIGALGEIMRLARRGAFSISLADQDVHLAVERALTERLGDAGKKVHTARSRNDQVAVDLRLYARGELLELTQETAALGRAFLAFARRHERVPMVGRTHLQPAMPSSVGLWAAAHAESLAEDMETLAHALALNDRCPLGSAASYGVPLGIDRNLTARLLGFAGPVHTVLHANNARGKLEHLLLSACGQVMLSVARAAEDLILFTMPEFGYFTLPAGCCTGSSIMPQKRNPDVAELARSRAARVLAHAACVGEIARALPSGYNRDLQDTKGPLMEGLAMTRGTVRAFLPLIRGLKVNAGRLRAAFGPEVFATDAALELVASGMPFRDAYHAVKARLDELGRRDPDEAVRRKTHVGAPAGLDLKGLEGRLDALARAGRSRRAAWHRAASKLLGVRYPIAP